MKILKIVLAFIIVVPLLSGCQFATTKKIYSQGYNLEEMGLNVIQKDDMLFKETNGLYKIFPGIGITNDLNSLNSPIKEESLIGNNISIIYGYFQGDDGILHNFPLKYIQGFKKAEIFLDNHYVMISSNPYHYTELENSMIYDDEQWIVYDITEYLSGFNIHEKINNLSKELDIVHNWLIEPYNYLDKKLPELISNRENKDTKYINNEIKFTIPGYSLNQMGLQLTMNDNISFSDPNEPRSKPSYTIVNSEITIPVTIIHEKENYDLYGDFSIIELSFSDGYIDMNELPVKYVQGYKKEEVKNNQNYVELNSKIYSFTDLDKNLIYEDDSWIVYEISEYLDILDIYSKLEIISADNRFNYNFNWLKGMDDYLVEHLTEMITINEKKRNLQ